MIPEFLQGVEGYPGIFLLCALSGIAFPLPEDISLLYAGIQLQQGTLSWPLTLGVAASGVMTRDVAAYTLGRFFGDWILSSALVTRLVGKKLPQARRMLEQRGSSAVFIGRFLIGVRATVFFAAGASGVSFRKFAVWNLIGMVLTVPPVVLLGFFFGEPLHEMASWALNRGRYVALMILAIFAAAVWLRIQQDTLRQKTLESTASPAPERDETA